MKRRCCCASSSASTSSRGASCMSSHGESLATGVSSSTVSKISSATSRCIHVVPHFGGVLMTMSPLRNGNRSHRALSATTDRYLVSSVMDTPGVKCHTRHARTRQPLRHVDDGQVRAAHFAGEVVARDSLDVVEQLLAQGVVKADPAAERREHPPQRECVVPALPLQPLLPHGAECARAFNG